MADFSSVALMLLLLATGFLLIKVKLLKSEQTRALSAVLLNAAYPAMIVDSVTSVDIGSLAKESVLVVAITIAITLALFFAGLGVLSRYWNANRKPLLLFTMAIGNIAYVVLPIVRAAFGDVGVYYLMLHSTAQDILIWTLYHAYFVSGGKLKGFNFRKILSPTFAAIVIAIVLSLMGIRPQGIVSDFLSMLASLAVPLALIFVGTVLAEQRNRRDWIPDRDTLLISGFKVVALPLAVFGIMQLVPAGADIKVMMALFFSAPAAVVSTIWAKEYGCDERFSVRVLTFSTLLFLAAAWGFMALYDGMF